VALTIATLLARCRDGDELAWEALVRRHQARVYGLCYHYLHDREEARDVAQEAFVRVYQRIDSVTDPERFLPWLIRVARNAALDRMRRMGARPRSDTRVEELPDLASGDPTPEARWEADRRRVLVHDALRAMSEKGRDVLVLREMQGLSEEETARILDVPVGTVKSRMNRARVELAKRVRELVGGAASGGSAA
jgi:RNA polymerase sigma-70 factor (ECF subfamily)